MRVNYVMIFVSDMGRATAFYRDVVGLTLKFQSPHWTEFSTGGANLALHLSESQTGKAEIGQAGSCRPGFAVPSIDEFHQRMLAKGVTCIQEPTTVFGSRLAQYEGPDGLVFSVGEERSIDRAM